MKEHQSVAWKQGGRDECLKGICAFANSQGGTLEIGENDRGYGVRAPIQISVYDCQLVIWNPGHHYDDWTVERLPGKHPSVPFNPLIANAFFRAGYIESWGRGFETIQRECQTHGIDSASVDTGFSGLMLTFRASDGYLAALRGDSAGEQMAGEPRKKPAGGRGTAQKTREKTREKIMSLLRDRPSLSTQEMSEALQVSRQGVEWQLRKLKEEGKLRRLGPDKGGHWEVLP